MNIKCSYKPCLHDLCPAPNLTDVLIKVCIGRKLQFYIFISVTFCLWMFLDVCRTMRHAQLVAGSACYLLATLALKLQCETWLVECMLYVSFWAEPFF